MPLNDSTANNVILEAIACGLPVVSSRLDGVRAYVPEDASILIERNDPRAFSEALLRLYRDGICVMKWADRPGSGPLSCPETGSPVDMKTSIEGYAKTEFARSRAACPWGMR